MRRVVYHGSLMDELEQLNAHPSWRNIFGKPNARLKDQELILRFLALYYNGDAYQSPMEEFLNKFAQKHREADAWFLYQCRSVFTTAVDCVWEALGQRAFRPTRALNAAVCDSVLVGLARRLLTGGSTTPRAIIEAYDTLLKDTDYMTAVFHSTSHKESVTLRLQKATQCFKQL